MFSPEPGNSHRHTTTSKANGDRRQSKQVNNDGLSSCFAQRSTVRTFASTKQARARPVSVRNIYQGIREKQKVKGRASWAFGGALIRINTLNLPHDPLRNFRNLTEVQPSTCPDGSITYALRHGLQQGRVVQTAE